MKGTSSVGTHNIYEADDQRTSKSTNVKPKDLAYEEGVKNSHQNTDPKDQRSIKNRLAAEEKKEKTRDDHSEKTDPRAAALSHGNEPSKGAKIDAQIQMEEEEELERKAKKGKDTLPGKKN
ncbi:hypothetical protein EDC01DRAFT_787698 [Geopyxis carbonaria]|nr:hypothetical protein EDC01DRAFT_787698 [Geopyxis carbonaria]